MALTISAHLRSSEPKAGATHIQKEPVRDLLNQPRFYPFTAPAVRPSTIRYWKIMTRITSGMVTTMDPAMIEPQGCSKEVLPENCEITTGTVFMLSVTVKVRANKNSFQAAMNARRPVETNPAMVGGSRL